MSSSRFVEDSDASDKETTETPESKPKIKRIESPIPFSRYVDAEAIESDGDGGDVDNDAADEHNDFLWVEKQNIEEEEEEEEEDNFVVMDNEIEYEDDVDSNDEETLNTQTNHMQITNTLLREIEDEQDDVSSDNNNENNDEKDLELETPNGDEQDDNKRKQELFNQLTQKTEPSEEGNKKRPRYYDLLTNDSNNAIDIDDESDEEDDSSQSEDDKHYIDSSDDENDEKQMNVEKSDDDESSSEEDESESEEDQLNVTNDGLSKLSKLDFEKLLSHTMANLALKLEENDNKNLSQIINPFASMDDKISLNDNNDELDMQQILSFIPDYDYNDKQNDDDDDDMDEEDINNPTDFHSIQPFEKSNNILPEPKRSSNNHPSNLKQSKLQNTTLSSSTNNGNKYNTFIQEEIRLAENTMKNAVTVKRNIERKNFAPPLSKLDPRVRGKKKGDNSGKSWFNMPRGRMTPQNKLHFLMMKYRHMIYRDYKPSKVRDDYVPKYFQMGTIIEGPTEFYSSRLTKKQRHSSWAKQYLSDPSTKQWLEQKTKRAQKRIRRPGSKFWAPMRKLNVNNRYKLRRRIIKTRKQKGWNKKTTK